MDLFMEQFPPMGVDIDILDVEHEMMMGIIAHMNDHLEDDETLSDDGLSMGDPDDDDDIPLRVSLVKCSNDDLELVKCPLPELEGDIAQTLTAEYYKNAAAIEDTDERGVFGNRILRFESELEELVLNAIGDELRNFDRWRDNDDPSDSDGSVPPLIPRHELENEDENHDDESNASMPPLVAPGPMNGNIDDDDDDFSSSIPPLVPGGSSNSPRPFRHSTWDDHVMDDVPDNEQMIYVD